MRSSKNRGSIAILGVPFDSIGLDDAVAEIELMAASGEPHYVVTPNVDFLAQARIDDELRHVLANADLSLCDGMPLVWASRLLGNPLPERVAGSDLVPALLALAARKGLRVYFLGASEEASAEAISRVQQQHPTLVIAGRHSPPFRELTTHDNDDIQRKIREARPDLVFVAFGCPKAEKWIAQNYRELGTPVMIGVGATIDFLAGRVRRAPRWMGQVGVEWLFRLVQEPRRLWKRYARDLWVLSWHVTAQVCMQARRRSTTKT
jgi:N-acetylglucosaminyldiphosphoundecaprenol N-acetyl-beta-D-mannosaminyltransferase